MVHSHTINHHIDNHHMSKRTLRTYWIVRRGTVLESFVDGDILPFTYFEEFFGIPEHTIRSRVRREKHASGRDIDTGLHGPVLDDDLVEWIMQRPPTDTREIKNGTTLTGAMRAARRDANHHLDQFNHHHMKP